MYGIEVRETDERLIRAEAWGEFDLFSLADLRSVLDGLVSLRRPVVVDLSGITFLDLQSARELAVYSRLYGHHLTFRNPSWQADRSIKACGLEDWADFHRESPVFSVIS